MTKPEKTLSGREQMSNYRLTFEFASTEAMLDWFQAGQEMGLIPEASEVYKADSLDMIHGNEALVYIVRRAGSRSEEFALRTQLERGKA